MKTKLDTISQFKKGFRKSSSLALTRSRVFELTENLFDSHLPSLLARIKAFVSSNPLTSLPRRRKWESVPRICLKEAAIGWPKPLDAPVIKINVFSPDFKGIFFFTSASFTRRSHVYTSFTRVYTR